MRSIRKTVIKANKAHISVDLKKIIDHVINWIVGNDNLQTFIVGLKVVNLT